MATPTAPTSSTLTIHITQRPGDRQWTWRAKARNGKQVAWAGEYFKRRGAVERIVAKLFEGRHDVVVTPTVKVKKA